MPRTITVDKALRVLRDDPRWTELPAEIRQVIGRQFQGTILVTDIGPEDLIMPTSDYLSVDAEADEAVLTAFVRLEIVIPGRGQRIPSEGLTVRMYGDET